MAKSYPTAALLALAAAIVLSAVGLAGCSSTGARPVSGGIPISRSASDAVSTSKPELVEEIDAFLDQKGVDQAYYGTTEKSKADVYLVGFDSRALLIIDDPDHNRTELYFGDGASTGVDAVLGGAPFVLTDSTTGNEIHYTSLLANLRSDKVVLTDTDETVHMGTISVAEMKAAAHDVVERLYPA